MLFRMEVPPNYLENRESFHLNTLFRYFLIMKIIQEALILTDSLGNTFGKLFKADMLAIAGLNPLWVRS